MPCYTKYSKTNWQLLGVQNVAWAIPWLSIREITAMGEIHSINASVTGQNKSPKVLQSNDSPSKT